MRTYFQRIHHKWSEFCPNFPLHPKIWRFIKLKGLSWIPPVTYLINLQILLAQKTLKSVQWAEFCLTWSHWYCLPFHLSGRSFWCRLRGDRQMPCQYWIEIQDDINFCISLILFHVLNIKRLKTDSISKLKYILWINIMDKKLSLPK